MKVLMYVYAPKPNVEQSLTLVSCMNANCRRPLFKTNSTNLTISNTGGFPIEHIPDNANYIEHQCHSCRTQYKILFQ